MKYFSLPTVLELKAYFLCRNANWKGCLPPKGTLGENMAGVQKLIYLAHSSQHKLIVYKKQVEDIGEISTTILKNIESDNEKNIITIDKIKRTMINVLFNHEEKPTFEITESYAQNARLIFCETSNLEIENDTIQKWNNKLENSIKIFNNRLKIHINTKVPKRKHLHWVWDFCFANIERMVSIMIVMDHLQNIFRVNNRYCLLNEDGNFENVETNSIGEREGCYLYRKAKNKIFVRSGKISNAKERETKRTFRDRHNEHKKNAIAGASSDMPSNFYLSYPSISCSSKNNDQEIGFFEDLEMVCALGFSRKTMNYEMLIKKDGLFLWEEEIKKKNRES